MWLSPWQDISAPWERALDQSQAMGCQLQLLPIQWFLGKCLNPGQRLIFLSCKVRLTLPHDIDEGSAL